MSRLTGWLLEGHGLQDGSQWAVTYHGDGRGVLWTLEAAGRGFVHRDP